LAGRENDLATTIHRRLYHICAAVNVERTALTSLSEHPMRRAGRLALPAILLLVIAALWIWTRPTISGVTVQRSDREISNSELPLTLDRPARRLDVWFTLRAQPLRIARYRIVANGCLDALSVNDRPLQTDATDACAIANGATVDLATAVHSGRNAVHVQMHDARPFAMLRFEPAAIDPLRATLTAAAIACAAWIAFALAAAAFGDQLDRGSFVIALGGAALRIVYVLGTYYSERAHDTGPHLDYARYLAANLRLPPAGGGWEFFQPPLYYAIAAAFLRGGAALGQRTESIFAVLQLFSLACALVTLGAALWIGAMLFPARIDRGRRRLFALAVAALPSLVFMASPISNDPMYEALSFVAGALLVFWWRHDSTRAWYAGIVVACLAVNTKSSGLVLLPIALTCLALRIDIPWRVRLRRVAASLAITVVGVASIPLMRAATDPTARRLVTMNVDGLPPALTLPSAPRNILTFDPAQVVVHPENFPWDDSQRRQFLLEFFFRSAFFGEYTFAPRLQPLERAILASALLGLPLIAFGAAREFGDAHPVWPMPVSAAALLAVFVLYRIKFPYAPSQDFRYVTFLAVPLTFFAVRGAFDLPRIARPFGIATIGTLAALCVSFIVLVIY
jgi:hypothetical protein